MHILRLLSTSLARLEQLRPRTLGLEEQATRQLVPQQHQLQARHGHQKSGVMMTECPATQLSTHRSCSTGTRNPQPFFILVLFGRSNLRCVRPAPFATDPGRIHMQASVSVDLSKKHIYIYICRHTNRDTRRGQIQFHVCILEFDQTFNLWYQSSVLIDIFFMSV